ncbi:RNA polymerase sigma factor [Kineosporia sp. A_224]|uniref:RNA polymerase sigma factor n=1 Tax=Kineosporia sp. A_224 TaxID=1962180 RepID=UPI0013042406|nr:sigma-70 family RNA polymerase sigma factor [Kineosporia sp. A_224]
MNELQDVAEFIRHADPVFRRVVTRWTAGDVATADDVVQETWIKLQQHWSSINRNRVGWCFRIARRELARAAKRDVRRRDGELRSVEASDGAEARQQDEECCRRDELMQMLGRLPARQRAVLTLDLEDRPDGEIARTLRMLPSTVRSTRRDALKSAKRVLEELRAEAVPGKTTQQPEDASSRPGTTPEGGPLTKPRPGPGR